MFTTFSMLLGIPDGKVQFYFVFFELLKIVDKN